RPGVVQDREILARDHPELFRRLVEGDLAEGADGGRRDGPTAKLREGRDALLAEELECAAIDGGRDVDDVAAAQPGGDARRPTLIEVHATGHERLGSRARRNDAGSDVQPLLLHV